MSVPHSEHTNNGDRLDTRRGEYSAELRAESGGSGIGHACTRATMESSRSVTLFEWKALSSTHRNSNVAALGTARIKSALIVPV